jgi:hypothetical protein
MDSTRIKSALRERYGEFQTFLEHKYEETITEKLLLGEFCVKDEWATYNQVILELKNNIKNMMLVKELQYRLTDNENPSKVCIDVINKSINHTPELVRLHQKIISFAINH